MTLESSIIISSVGIGVAITLAMMGLLIRQVNRSIASLEQRMTSLERGQAEFRQEMRAEFAAFKEEVRADSAGLRQEMREFKEEMRADSARLRQEMHEFREEMRAEMSEFREEMRTSVEKLDTRLRAVEHNQERFSGQVSTLERFVVESIRARQAAPAPAPVEAD